MPQEIPLESEVRIHMDFFELLDNLVAFDTSKIVEAISYTTAVVSELCAEIIEEMKRSLFSALHDLSHWCLSLLSSINEPVCESNSSNTLLALFVAFPICLNMDILPWVFAEIGCKTRKFYLLRTQDRGSSDFDSGFVSSCIVV